MSHLADVFNFVTMMDEMKDVQFIAWEEQSNCGFRQILSVSNNFEQVFGNVMMHIFFCESHVESIDIAEGEEGIVIEYKTNYPENSQDSDYIFILWNKASLKTKEE